MSVCAAHSEVASQGLLDFNALEQGLEVSSTKALMIASLDDFQEESGAILEGLGEDLQQVTLVVVVHQDLQALQGVDVLLHLGAHILEAFSQSVVVLIGDLVEELDATSLHALDGGDDIFGAHGDVLHAGAAIVLDKLLNLTLANSISRLVDGHLDVLVEVSHDDGTQRGELSVDHLVVDRPEAMEVKHLLVPLGGGFHLTVGLISDTVVDEFQFGNRCQFVHRFGGVMGSVAGQEGSLEVHSLHEGMDGVSISSDRGSDHGSLLVLELLGLVNASGAALDGLLVDASGIVDGECDIFNTVTVLLDVVRHLTVARVQGRREGKHNLTVAHNVSADITLTGLKTLQKRKDTRSVRVE